MNSKELHNEFVSLRELINNFLENYSEYVQAKKEYLIDKSYRKDMIDMFRTLEELRDKFLIIIAEDFIK